MDTLFDRGETDTTAMWDVPVRIINNLYKRSHVAFPYDGDEAPRRTRRINKPKLTPPMPRQHCNNCGITHDA